MQNKLYYLILIANAIKFNLKLKFILNNISFNITYRTP